MFKKERTIFRSERVIIVSGLGDYSLSDTLECGQAFRYERTQRGSGYDEYMTVFGDHLLRVGQSERGKLIFFTDDEELIDTAIAEYFTLERDYAQIREDIISRTDSEWLKSAAASASGIAILKQDPWETLFSFIISQNNNIPRIRKIIRKICSLYGKNLATAQGLTACPLGRCEGEPTDKKCKECGACFTFPAPADILARPELLREANTGFRLRYLLDAADKVYSGECDLERIAEAGSYERTLEELKRIVGVGDKVASCVALFGFANLEAFPIDVWMRRAIDEYFDGSLDPTTLGKYAGIAQQYIFHYIRNLGG